MSSCLSYNGEAICVLPTAVIIARFDPPFNEKYKEFRATFTYKTAIAVARPYKYAHRPSV
jgi:hypothetical protein